MIGLSLSYCVRDIVKKEIPLEKVEKIIAATMATNENIRDVLDSYAKTCWKFDPIQCVMVANILFDAGKIRQPRLDDPNRFPKIFNSIWVESEDEIEWSKK